MAVPTIILFHNSRPIIKYNESEVELTLLVKYLSIFTGLEPRGDVELHDMDLVGPVPTREEPEPNYYLALAWIFTIVCSVWCFGKSSICRFMIESLRNAWREAEVIQHDHQD